jgi:hypothetical protein
MAASILIIILYLVIELVYLTSIIYVIRNGIHFIKTCIDRKLKILIYVILIFSALSFGSTIIINVANHSLPQRIIYFLYLATEILEIFLIMRIAIPNSKKSPLLIVLLFVCAAYLIYLTIRLENFTSYYPFFAIESFVAGSITLLYFTEITQNLEKQNLFELPITWIILGLFFCYSLPLAFYTFSSFVALFDQNADKFYSSIEKSKAILFVVLSRLMTISYIVFNYFLIKAFKCNTYIPTTGS